ncbi:hypothetical protein NCC78_13305 [Micromonospora phytophila]|uniref:hypothetical protein n=1 Tax=Micromonospora phytophila TaxID=709888 RepID=UPI00202F1993|nr:hypothetical protein [Micromonospora phytophila]MCM0675658.1 hypothetical protein [Micromonospora phytophila]
MTNQKPSVVLVHGGFAKSANWSGGVERLQDRSSCFLLPAAALGASRPLKTALMGRLKRDPSIERRRVAR